MDFINKLQEEINKKPMLDHPFYQMWKKGTLPLTAIQKYAEQYYHLEFNFPRFLSIMHAGCEDFSVRQVITANLHDEEHGDKNHLALWKQFGHGIGAGDVTGAALLPETQAAIHVFRNLCNADFLQGSAALAAYESQLPAVAESKINGLKQHYGITDMDTHEFFSVHATLDKAHADAWWTIIREHCTSEDQAKVLKAVQEGRDALWGFLDGVYKAYVPEATC